jgi:hypothetical protein
MIRSGRVLSGLVVLAAACWLAGCGGDKSEPEPDSVTIEQIAIEFPRDASDMPSYWTTYYEKEPIVDPLPKEQTKAAAKILGSAIARYPDGFLNEHVTNVFVYSDMLFYGNRSMAGITAEPSNIFVSYNYADPFWLELMFHTLSAELLSLKYPDLMDQVGFDYPVTVTERELADAEDRDESLLKKGYLFPQAARSVGDDFSYIAGALMAGSRSAVQDAKDYKLIGEKMAKVKKFFLLLDERFTEDFFKQQSEGAR